MAVVDVADDFISKSNYKHEIHTSLVPMTLLSMPMLFFLSAANRRNVKSALETTLSGVTVTVLTTAASYRIANDPAGSEYTGGYVQGCIALPEALLVANKHRHAHRLGQSGTRY